MKKANFSPKRINVLKEDTYRKALNKVWKNNPELIESQMRSNSKKNHWKKLIKVNHIYIILAVLFFIVTVLAGIILKNLLCCCIAAGIICSLITVETLFIMFDIKFWSKMANVDFQLYRKWKFEFAKVGYELQ